MDKRIQKKKVGFESLLDDNFNASSKKALQMCGCDDCDSNCDCHDCDYNCQECDSCDCDAS